MKVNATQILPKYRQFINKEISTTKVNTESSKNYCVLKLSSSNHGKFSTQKTSKNYCDLKNTSNQGKFSQLKSEFHGKFSQLKSEFKNTEIANSIKLNRIDTSIIREHIGI